LFLLTQIIRSPTIDLILFRFIVKDEPLSDLEHGGPNRVYAAVYVLTVCFLQKIAHDAHCLRQPVHKEIMIRAQLLNRRPYLIGRRRNRLIGGPLTQSSQNSRKEMKMLGANMNCQSRPEQIQFVMADQDITPLQSLPQLAQNLIQSGVIVG